MAGAVQAGVAVTPAAVLDKVLDDILTDESKWCQKATARNSAGDSVDISVNAVKHCSLGAIDRAVLDLYGDDFQAVKTDHNFWDIGDEVTRLLSQVIGGEEWPGNEIISFNDDAATTFEDVRLAFKKARELVDE